MGSRDTERRRQPRYPRRMTLRTVSDEHGLVELESANIGPGGAYCISPKAFPEMARLEVMLVPTEPPHDDTDRRDPLRIESVVVRSEPADEARYSIALFFPRLTDDQASLLQRYLPDALTDRE